MSPVLPLAALAALLLLGSKAAPRGVVTPGEPTLVKKPATAKPAAKPAARAAVRPVTKPAAKPAAKPNEALQAAQLAEKQTGKPRATQSVDVHKGVAQTVTDPKKPLPAGYSAQQAGMKAQPVADHIRTRKGKYDRALLQSFQTSAGLKTDGLYGPQARAALVFFGAKNVPAALFKGPITKYAPPAGG